jgi:hypothetical protein
LAKGGQEVTPERIAKLRELDRIAPGIAFPEMLAEIERLSALEIIATELARSRSAEGAAPEDSCEDCLTALAEIERLRMVEENARSLSDRWRKQIFSPACLGTDEFERDAVLNACADDLEAILA